MKKIIDYNPYDSIYCALLKDGYSENEAEELIADVIEEQLMFTEIADKLHSIIEEANGSEYFN